MRRKFDLWYKKNYANNKKKLWYFAEGKGRNHQIQTRPQISHYDRMKSKPLKVLLEAMRESGQDTKDLQPYREDSSIWTMPDGYGTEQECKAIISFNASTYIRDVFILANNYPLIEINWDKAWTTVSGKGIGTCGTKR